MNNKNTISIQFINEFEIDLHVSQQINQLLQASFPYVHYEKRIYFKQLPHYRILAYQKNKIIGQLGIDYRAMLMNNTIIKVWGLIDLCIDADYKRKGIAKCLLNEALEKANANKENIDFIFCVTDVPDFYLKNNFNVAQINKATWLKIDNHINLGIGNEHITDTHFMYKAIGNKQWQPGSLDWLGYMY